MESCSDCQCDSVIIYDGSSDLSSSIQTLCNTDSRESITSSGNTVYAYFTSDGGDRYRGFEIQYSTVEGKTGCIGPFAVG